MRHPRWLLALALVPVLVWGCDLSDELKEEPCDVDDDCWHTQHCARTQAEEQAGLPGLCMPKDVPCVMGEQLGCACLPDDTSQCLLSVHPTAIEYPQMICDPTLLVCVVDDPDATSEG